jgi:hypothetical protein
MFSTKECLMERRLGEAVEKNVEITFLFKYKN